MFALKEVRRVFSLTEVEGHFKKNGFGSVSTHTHIMRDFNVNNWVLNSGLSKNIADKIIKMHYNAPSKVKRAYNMKFVDGCCLIDTKNEIVVGERHIS